MKDFKLEEVKYDEAILKKFEDLNKIDIDIWREFKNNPIEPNKSVNIDISRKTVVVRDNQMQGHHEYESNIVDTLELEKLNL